MIPSLIFCRNFGFFFKRFRIFSSKFFPDVDQISSDEPIEKTKQLRKEGEIKNPRHHIEFYENH